MQKEHLEYTIATLKALLDKTEKPAAKEKIPKVIDTLSSLEWVIPILEEVREESHGLTIELLTEREHVTDEFLTELSDCNKLYYEASRSKDINTLESLKVRLNETSIYMCNFLSAISLMVSKAERVIENVYLTKLSERVEEEKNASPAAAKKMAKQHPDYQLRISLLERAEAIKKKAELLDKALSNIKRDILQSISIYRGTNI